VYEHSRGPSTDRGRWVNLPSAILRVLFEKRLGAGSLGASKANKRKQCAGAWLFLGTMGKEEKSIKKLVLYCLTLKVSQVIHTSLGLEGHWIIAECTFTVDTSWLWRAVRPMECCAHTRPLHDHIFRCLSARSWNTEYSKYSRGTRSHTDGF
jgi:hypothetical protein